MHILSPKYLNIKNNIFLTVPNNLILINYVLNSDLNYQSVCMHGAVVSTLLLRYFQTYCSCTEKMMGIIKVAHFPIIIKLQVGSEPELCYHQFKLGFPELASATYHSLG